LHRAPWRRLRSPRRRDDSASISVFAYQGTVAVITAALGATDVKSKDKAIGLEGSEHGEEG
jgi:hypothetical protein